MFPAIGLWPTTTRPLTKPPKSLHEPHTPPGEVCAIYFTVLPDEAGAKSRIEPSVAYPIPRPGWIVPPQSYQALQVPPTDNCHVVCSVLVVVTPNNCH